MPSLASIGSKANAGTVYGLVAMGVLLAVESDHNETYPEAVGSVALTLAIYWLTHSYADALGEQLRVQGRLTGASLRRALVDDWSIVRGATLPLLVLLLAWAFGARPRTGLDAALWSAIASLVVLELLAANRAGVRGRGMIFEGLLAGGIALAIIALKVILA
jgi:hypothetical protein